MFKSDFDRLCARGYTIRKLARRAVDRSGIKYDIDRGRGPWRTAACLEQSEVPSCDQKNLNSTSIEKFAECLPVLEWIQGQAARAF